MQNFVKVTVDRRVRVMSSGFWFAGLVGQVIVTPPLRLEHGLLLFCMEVTVNEQENC